MKSALITGISGQDGSIIAKKLSDLGLNVCGTFRRGDSRKLWRLEELGIINTVNLIDLDLQEELPLLKLLDQTSPDYIFHFAGNSFVADSFKQPQRFIGDAISTTLNLLEVLKYRNSRCWTFIAGSSEIYGGLQSEVIDESSAPHPANPYGVAKASVQSLMRIYASSYKLNTCFGILFNHESEFRSRSFVTRKISYNIARLMLNSDLKPMKLGNLNSARDWSSAYDFIDSILGLASHQAQGDFIFSSGHLTSLRDYLSSAAVSAGFVPEFVDQGLNERLIDGKTGRELAVVSEDYFRPYDTKGKVGDNSKLKALTSFKSPMSIAELADSMVTIDIKRLSDV